MMNPFSLTLLFGLIGPPLAVGGFAYFWRKLLTHFRWFIGIGAVATYLLMAMCLVGALSGVGITGNVASTSAPTFTPFAIHCLSFMLLWLAGSAIILYLIRYLLSKL